ncbi:MAG: hypothetical protein R3C12_11805 [Planctomycetaceae bacterium]
MDFTLILPYAIFSGIVALIWFFYSLTGNSEERIAERLEDIRDPSRRFKEDADKQEGMGGMLNKAAPRFRWR